MWAVRQKGRKEHSPLLPIAEERPRELVQALCERGAEPGGTSCSIGFANLDITGLALHQVLGANGLERVRSHETEY